jgi:hypothetical protein
MLEVVEGTLGVPDVVVVVLCTLEVVEGMLPVVEEMEGIGCGWWREYGVSAGGYVVDVVKGMLCV